MSLRGLAGVVAGLAAALAWILIPGHHSLASDIKDDALALSCLATIVAIVAVAIVVGAVLNTKVHTAHRRRVTVFQMVWPYVLVAVVAALIAWFVYTSHIHFAFTLRWFTDMWRTGGFVADVIAFGAISLAVFWPSSAPATRTDTSRSSADPASV